MEVVGAVVGKVVGNALVGGAEVEGILPEGSGTASHGAVVSQ